MNETRHIARLVKCTLEKRLCCLNKVMCKKVPKPLADMLDHLLYQTVNIMKIFIPGCHWCVLFTNPALVSLEGKNVCQTKLDLLLNLLLFVCQKTPLA